MSLLLVIASLLSVIFLQFIAIIHLLDRNSKISVSRDSYKLVKPMIDETTISTATLGTTISPTSSNNNNNKIISSINNRNCDGNGNGNDNINDNYKRNSNSPVEGHAKSSSYTDDNPIEGVAVTLMLHSPTWFQRRYTMMLQNILNNLPTNWKVQIFHTGVGQSLNGIQINHGINKLFNNTMINKNNHRIIFTLIPKAITAKKRKRFELMTELWLWENIIADKVLIFEGNSVICSNSPYTINNFEHFDYIGSPWKAFNNIGGDGLFSLRNRLSMIEIITYELNKHTTDKKLDAYKKWGQEDHFFVSRILEINSKKSQNHYNGNNNQFKISQLDDTKFACISDFYSKNCWAVSGPVPGITFEQRTELLQVCPEIKMFYPVLHEPSCYGATPNRTQCALFTCSLNPNRKGGCI